MVTASEGCHAAAVQALRDEAEQAQTTHGIIDDDITESTAGSNYGDNMQCSCEVMRCNCAKPCDCGSAITLLGWLVCLGGGRPALAYALYCKAVATPAAGRRALEALLHDEDDAVAAGEVEVYEACMRWLRGRSPPLDEEATLQVLASVRFARLPLDFITGTVEVEPLLRSSALTTKRASSRARMASGDGLRATCSRSGSYMRQPAASALGRVRSARPLHPLTNSSPGCHRIGRECSPGPRWHGRLACIRP